MLKTIKTKLKIEYLLIVVVCALGIWLRLYHNDFGLPNSYHADEPEFVEYAINYTFSLKQIIIDGDYYKLIPVSFVYGTLPTYILTGLTMVFSRVHNIFNAPFSKADIYQFLRSFMGIFTFIIAPLAAGLYYKMFKNQATQTLKFGIIATLFLVALNWKLIVLGHYVNADILVTLFLLPSFYFVKLFIDKPNSKKYVLWAALFFGLAISTKITALISVPLYLYVFFKKDRLYSFLVFIFVCIGLFLLTNPFSIVFFERFSFRVFSLGTKEAGLVFDSVDRSYFKYFSGLSYMLTLPVFILSIYGALKSEKGVFKWFLLGNVLLYFIFYSIQGRRVDRWLLPILPILLLYASYGLSLLKNTRLFSAAFIGILFYYLYFPALLLTQFKTDTPRSAAYTWLQTQITGEALKLGYTEEGLDPLNRVDGMDMQRMGVYSSENGQFIVPKDPLLYDYVVLASKPMEYFKKEEVKQTYPFYYDRWNTFETTVLDQSKFKLVKEFTLSKPNLIPLTDIFVYERIK